MGLFGGGNSKVTSESTTNTITDNSIVGVDAGALDAAVEIATRSLEASASTSRDSLLVASDATRDALSFGESSLVLADRAGERQSDALTDALSFSRQIIAGALDALGLGQADALTFADRQNTRVSDAFLGASDMIASAYESAFDTAGDVLRSGQASIADTVTNLNAISRQASTSDSERMQSITKYALIAAAVMVAAFAFRGSK